MGSRQASTRPVSHGHHQHQHHRSRSQLSIIPCILIASISLQLLSLILSSSTTQAEAAPANVLGVFEENAVNENPWMDSHSLTVEENRSPVSSSQSLPPPSKRGDHFVLDKDRIAQGLIPTDPTRWGYNDSNVHAPVRVKANSEFKPALTQCKSEALGPAWNGTFASNSPDGFYESQNRTCTWTIQAATSTNPTIVVVHFITHIQLICGVDYLTLYDGPDVHSPVIARLCSTTWNDSTPTLYSSGPQMTAVFTSQASSPGAFGFTAGWSTMDTAGSKDFYPRSQHAMAYDPAKDMVYIMGGTSAGDQFTWDLLTYTFGSNKWNSIKVSQGTLSPEPRYGHFAFVYDSNLYVYGGVTTIGGTDEVWRFNGKIWSKLQPNNPEQRPAGKIGSACVVVTRNNSTALYVFGGMVPGGASTRDLYTYDLGTEPKWRKIDHKNSVGLSGASAVYHQATDSIYYFGGMVNQTTRNTLVYQYLISQELWYALGPRVDPLTAELQSHGPAPSVGNGTNIDETSDAPVMLASVTPAYKPPVMYDPISSVWAPAQAADDYVIIYGGMRPFGPGVNERDQSCLVRTMSIYDLSCQRWVDPDTIGLGGLPARVNHTMVLRPPGKSPSANKTAWTAYIFGGFDGSERNDIVNVTLSIPLPPPKDVNHCRALRWCSQYDDCQNCNPNYCSYIGGLCLFDTDKGKNALIGTSDDVPLFGTLQDLVQQQPELKSSVLAGPNDCPLRITLDLNVTYPGSIEAGEEKTFKIYVDAHDSDILFQVQTVPNWNLDFKSLNVWEGFMNMYWRADHGLTDNSWDGKSPISSPKPNDLTAEAYYNSSAYGRVITPEGFLNTSELLRRWQSYSGLDASLSSSAIRSSVMDSIVFQAQDPRRFSGYYVFSLTNNNPSVLKFSVTVSVLNHADNGPPPTGAKFDLATLGFFMVGFILAVIVLVFVIRKIRRLMEEREMARHSLELRILEEEEEEEERNRQRGGGRARRNADGVEKKPMYKIVVGVQVSDPTEQAGLRHRERSRTIRYQGEPVHSTHIQEPAVSISEDKRRSRVRSDYIRDLGSLTNNIQDRQDRLSKTVSVSEDIISSDLVMLPQTASSPEVGIVSTPSWRESKKLDRRHSQQERKRNRDSNQGGDLRLSTGSTFSTLSGLQRGWSLQSLGRSASLKRIREQIKICPEEREGLTQLEGSDQECEHPRLDSDHEEMLDLATLPPSQIRFQDQQPVQARRRNPTRIQPISIEPVPFHGALVPQNKRYLRRYHRNLARNARCQLQRQQALQHPSPTSVNNILSFGAGLGPSRTPSRRSFTVSRSTSQRAVIRPSPSQGSLRQVQRTASLMTSRTFGGRSKPGTPTRQNSGERNSRDEQHTQEWIQNEATGIELTAMSERGRLQRGEYGQGEIHAEPSGHVANVPRKPIRMRGRQEYEPGPLLAVNVLIVFPGDAETRKIMQGGEVEDGRGGARPFGTGEQHQDTLYYSNHNSYNNGRDDDEIEDVSEQRLPPMAIGTVFVPDPVRWWAYKAQHLEDQRHFERKLQKIEKQKEA
ncbi:Multiple epidermal growth factor-like domains protein 8 [Podila clonocystis]|nr:Multiple epidermal growth factor-like domains protein 8 [Podila clonocystis]